MQNGIEWRHCTPTDFDANIVAVTAAIAALKKEMAGGFLQTAAAQALWKLVQGKQSMLDASREEILSFLSNEEDSKYTPRNGEITGDHRDPQGNWWRDVKRPYNCNKWRDNSNKGLWGADCCQEVRDRCIDCINRNENARNGWAGSFNCVDEEWPH